MSRSVRFALALLAVATPVLAQQAPPPACNSPDHRAFDFWVGIWDVYGPQGRKAGVNVIDTLYAHCVIRERYTTTPGGYAGSSLNTYDASRKVWHQTWMDNSGLLLVIEGGIRDKSMVMEGETRPAGRKPVRNRITWTPLTRDSLRQQWEVWSDSAGAWTTAFDGAYSRRKGDNTPPEGVR